MSTSGTSSNKSKLNNNNNNNRHRKPIKSQGVRIVNVVSHSKLGMSVDINKLAAALSGRCKEPVFPAGIVP
jgi:hypothetical protein